MLDAAVRKVDPLLTRQKSVQFSFDFHRIFRRDQAETPANSSDLRVDNDSARNSVGISEYHVSSLPSHTR